MNVMKYDQAVKDILVGEREEDYYMEARQVCQANKIKDHPSKESCAQEKIVEAQ